uniref:Uncharacterized protein n=1 Tax=Gouania willdenowi TaxID=441366 RepID=A0A8C5D6F1_GOUWI
PLYVLFFFFMEKLHNRYFFIGSRFLLKMRKTAEQHLQVSVQKVVISVPAEFDERQRNSTIRTAKLAGFMDPVPASIPIHPSIHPSIFFHLSVVGSRGRQHLRVGSYWD